MEIEMLLQDALHEATAKFKENVKVLNDNINGKSDKFLQDVGEQSSTFSGLLKDAGIIEQDQFMRQIEQQGDDEQHDDSEEFNMKLDIFGSKEDLNQYLDNYKEFLDLKINGCYKKIISAIKSD